MALEKVTGDYEIVEKYLTCRSDEDLTDCTTDSVYDDFCEWAIREGRDPYIVARRTFKVLLTKRYGFKTKVVKYKGRSTRVYVKE